MRSPLPPSPTLSERPDFVPISEPDAFHPGPRYPSRRLASGVLVTALLMSVFGVYTAQHHREAETSASFADLLARGDIAEAHGALWESVRSGNAPASPNPVPTDYRYAFESVWPEPPIGVDSVAAAWSVNDSHLLAVLPNHGVGHVRVAFNAERSAGFLDARRRGAAATSGRWLVTAAYTSPLVWPAGAFVHDGWVRNPAPQDWDGLVLVGQDRSIRILDVRRLRLGDRRLDLEAQPRVWIDVLAAASRSGITLFQQHLVVRNGQTALQSGSSPRTALRRALFETRSGTVAVFDSGNEALSLAALADRLVGDYGAWRAVNLDTGTYSVAERHENGRLAESRSTLGSGVVITSLLEIDIPGAREGSDPDAK